VLGDVQTFCNIIVTQAETTPLKTFSCKAWAGLWALAGAITKATQQSQNFAKVEGPNKKPSRSAFFNNVPFREISFVRAGWSTDVDIKIYNLHVVSCTVSVMMYIYPRICHGILKVPSSQGGGLPMNSRPCFLPSLQPFHPDFSSV